LGKGCDGTEQDEDEAKDFSDTHGFSFLVTRRRYVLGCNGAVVTESRVVTVLVARRSWLVLRTLDLAGSTRVVAVQPTSRMIETTANSDRMIRMLIPFRSGYIDLSIMSTLQYVKT
jgi:hypothetical protein